MRTRPFLVVALCSLGTIVHVVGAPASVRDQVQTLLADPAIVAASPEIEDAKRHARAALDAASTVRSGTDDDRQQVAAVLDETALEWAQMAKELVDLAALQGRADKAEQRQADLESQLKREKAHLEETEARRGRALAALKKLGETASGETSPDVPAPTQTGVAQ